MVMIFFFTKTEMYLCFFITETKYSESQYNVKEIFLTVCSVSYFTSIVTLSIISYETLKHAKCVYKTVMKASTLTDFVILPHGNEDILRAAVAQVGPIAVGVDASQPTFHFYKRGRSPLRCNPWTPFYISKAHRTILLVQC